MHFKVLSNLCLSVLPLVYLGDPSRNIQIPYSVLKIAKTRLRPDLSAKYIILHLFPEEILIRSNVYGNMDCGLFTLDSNRIDALKGLLHVDYKRINASQWYLGKRAKRRIKCICLSSEISMFY